jgi:glycosyltransferase involved in cell wall biosynthesis
MFEVYHLMKNTTRFGLIVGLAGWFAVMTTTHAQLDSTYREHGGLETWRFFGVAEFDLTWQMGDKPARKEHHTIELRHRRILIKADSYTVGFDGADCWVAPNLASFQGPPARFWVSTPFYFFGVPFVFADPGAKIEPLGTKPFRGRDHDVFKVTYGKGVGDTPEDDYVVYVDRISRGVRLVHYIVTYPSLRGNKPVAELERHALVYEDWRSADRLVAPYKAAFYNWKDDNVQGEPLGSATFENVRFRRVPPDPNIFARPKQSEVDTSLGR